jgi:methylated-DNA-[protein]-cysteine S-methyltransferase
MINYSNLFPECQIARMEHPVIGAIHLCASIEGLALVDLLHEDDFFTWDSQKTNASTDILMEAQSQILQYFEGSRKTFDLPIDWTATTSFQRRVLAIAVRIPFGEVQTYGDIARSMSMPNGSRAIGNALANNPLPIVIPCHRVIAADGDLQGYAARNSIRTKAWLLQHEGVDIDRQKLG